MIYSLLFSFYFLCNYLNLLFFLFSILLYISFFWNLKYDIIKIVTTSPSVKQQAAEAGKTTEPQTPDSETSKAGWQTFFSMYTRKFIFTSVYMYMHALQRKSHICIPFLGIAQTQSQSVSELYIPRISPHISCSRLGRSIVGIYISLTDTWMWKLGLRPSNSFSGNICFEFWVFILCSVSKYSRWSKNRWRRLLNICPEDCCTKSYTYPYHRYWNFSD